MGIDPPILPGMMNARGPKRAPRGGFRTVEKMLKRLNLSARGAPEKP